MKFKEFLKKTDRIDVEKALDKIPKSHHNLIKDYKISFEGESTLKGDSGHIGFIDEKKKIITIAAPWYYGREFTFLHEIAHAVWKHIVSEDQKKRWDKLIKSNKKKQKENLSKEAAKSLDQKNEEIFCMVYANYYTKHKILTYNDKNYYNFIKNL